VDLAVAEKKPSQMDAVTSVFAMAGEKQQEEAEQDTEAGFPAIAQQPPVSSAPDWNSSKVVATLTGFEPVFPP